MGRRERVLRRWGTDAEARHAAAALAPVFYEARRHASIAKDRSIPFPNRAATQEELLDLQLLDISTWASREMSEREGWKRKRDGKWTVARRVAKWVRPCGRGEAQVTFRNRFAPLSSEPGSVGHSHPDDQPGQPTSEEPAQAGRCNLHEKEEDWAATFEHRDTSKRIRQRRIRRRVEKAGQARCLSTVVGLMFGHAYNKRRKDQNKGYEFSVLPVEFTGSKASKELEGRAATANAAVRSAFARLRDVRLSALLHLSGEATGKEAGQAALAKMLKFTSGSYVRDDIYVQLTLENVMKVAEPKDDEHVMLSDGLPAKVCAAYSNGHTLVQGDPFANSTIDRPRPWVGATRAAYASYLRGVRDRSLWGFLPPCEVAAYNHLFFVRKKDDNLRKILACDVGANRFFIPSPSVKLPGPWQFKRLRVKGGRWVVGDADVNNFFTRLGLFPWMRKYFATKPILVSKIMTSDERRRGFMVCPVTGKRFTADQLCAPVYNRVPMGFSHAVFLALEVLEYQLSSVVRGISLNLPTGDDSPISIDRDDMAYGMYVDNIITLGAKNNVVKTGLRCAIGHCDKIGLHIGESHMPRRRMDQLGMAFDGDKNTIAYPPERCVLLQKATYHLCSFRRVQWKSVQRLAGHFAWAFILRRELFAIFGAIYNFCETFKDAGDVHWVDLWPSVRSELRMAADMLPLCLYQLGLQAAPLVACSDAEGPNNFDNGGGAVVTAHISTREISYLTTIAPAHPSKDAAAFGQTISTLPWKTRYQRRWAHRDHINETELETILAGVKTLATGDPSVQDAWVLWLTDSTVALYVVRKGRSSKYGLRRRLLRLAGWLVFFNIRLDVRWVPSEWCVADAPSRDRDCAWWNEQKKEYKII